MTTLNNNIMKQQFLRRSLLFSFLLVLFLFITACESDSDESFSDSDSEASDTFSDGAAGPVDGPGNGGESSGLITAGEWNDLDNWGFWNNLFNEKDYEGMPDYWEFYTSNRIAIEIKASSGAPLINAAITLSKDGDPIWETRTDNLGTAELFIGLNDKDTSPNSADYDLFVEGTLISQDLAIDGTLNTIISNETNAVANDVELAFIVDATGSMSDELEFLKKDLEDVITTVKNNAPDVAIKTASVFYRDEGDDYVVKHSGFSPNIATTLNFIKEQSADGGGDFPEAVHTALNTALTEIQWSTNAKTRLAFLLLDAPPHYDPQIVDTLHKSIEDAAEKGIKIIPITASGIDKNTEFLMRFFATATNGTYVFITDDSGIGNDHLEPSVGQFEVELLNELMVRLITKYSE